MDEKRASLRDQERPSGALGEVSVAASISGTRGPGLECEFGRGTSLALNIDPSVQPCNRLRAHCLNLKATGWQVSSGVGIGGGYFFHQTQTDKIPYEPDPALCHRGATGMAVDYRPLMKAIMAPHTGPALNGAGEDSPPRQLLDSVPPSAGVCWIVCAPTVGSISLARRIHPSRHDVRAGFAVRQTRVCGRWRADWNSGVISSRCRGWPGGVCLPGTAGAGGSADREDRLGL
jgi:hypothetical protein